MRAEDPMMVDAATVFVVTDIAKSTEHYRDVLGCAVTFEFGTPAFYVGLCRNEVALHLLSASQTSRLSGDGGMFVKGCRCRLRRIGGVRSQDRKPPQNDDYDMRDFDLIDLNGNQLIFEMGSAVCSVVGLRETVAQLQASASFSHAFRMRTAPKGRN